VDWTKAILETIDLRSFSNVWYWIGVIVLWSSLSHWIIGVPYDMIARAKRRGGDAEKDLIDLARVNVNRVIDLSDSFGPWIIGFNFFLASSMGLLGFFYGFELAQAMFLMLVPVIIVGVLTVRAAKKIEREAQDVEMLCKILNTHRVYIQAIGTLSIFVTSMYGMYDNLLVPAF